MTSQFDPSTFLNATITEANKKRDPLPTQDYVAVIKDVSSRQWTGRNDPTKSGVALDVELVLDIPEDVRKSTGLLTATVTIKDSIMLDLTPSGAIDTSPGRNRKLGMYRNATGTNKAGEPFSPAHLTGKTLVAKVKHDIWNDEIQEKIAAVAKLA